MTPDLYDNMTLHLERLDQDLELMREQACRGGEPLPEGFWFIHAGLRRASKKLRRNLDKCLDKNHKQPGPRAVS